MKKIKFGSVEILGYIGMAIWLAVIFLRNYHLSSNSVYIFILCVLPNWGAAWVATSFGNWIVQFLLKIEVTIKKYMFICIGVFALALTSEIIHDLFLNSPFDLYDMIVTAIAQLLMFFIPIMVKDQRFEGYM